MKDIIYWSSEVQALIDEYESPVRERINFELVAIQTNCPCAFDNFYIQGSDCDTVGNHTNKVKIQDAIGLHAMQLCINVIANDIEVIVYIAKFDEAIYILHSFTTEMCGPSSTDFKVAAERYTQIEKYREKKFKIPVEIISNLI